HFRTADEARTESEQRHDAVQAQVFVEIGAADMNAAGSQDVAAAVRLFRALRRQAHQREIGRATADIGDQYQFFSFELGFVIEGRSDRFVLEFDFPEADRLRDLV